MNIAVYYLPDTARSQYIQSPISAVLLILVVSCWKANEENLLWVTMRLGSKLIINPTTWYLKDDLHKLAIH